MSRRPEHGYIDEAGDDPAYQPQSSDLSQETKEVLSSGSSIEEESEGEPYAVEDSDVDLDGLGIEDDFDEEGEWDVEGEDWELADGDFTKQYNRVRQQQAATAGTVPLPARNIPQQRSKSSKRNPVAGAGVATNPKASSDKHDKDKSDRATQEQVLDSRTRLVLAGLVNRGVISKIERCISTGKEANVYFSAPSRAVKIYRTSILVFRSRQNYIVGEQRFRGEYTSSRNPRKMIRVWAEKELRNLRRLVQGGVRAPVVHECKENVLVMDFLGVTDEQAAPRLKDAEIDPERLQDLYAELIIATRRMYQHCHLVHADLSEYNILLHNDHLYIIDVSQSVEHDHPRAFDFLRSDLSNVEEFFGRRGTSVLGLRRAWEFVVTEDIGISRQEEMGDEGERRLAGIVMEWIKQPSDKTEDAVFMESYIPRTLADVYDPERDVDVLKSGGGDDLIYAGVTGLKIAQSQQSVTSGKEPCPRVVRFQDDDMTDDGSDAESEGEEDKEDDGERKPRGHRHEDKDTKKERKKAVKEENKEKRKNKMPKAEKQRLMKKSSGRH